MKKSFLRATSIALAIAIGGAVAMPSFATPSQPATVVTTSSASNLLPPTTLDQPWTTHATSFEVEQADDCSHLTHHNFCYCTSSPCHDE